MMIDTNAKLLKELNNAKSEIFWLKSKLHRIGRIVEEMKETDDPTLQDVADDLERITESRLE